MTVTVEQLHQDYGLCSVGEVHEFTSSLAKQFVTCPKIDILSLLFSSQPFKVPQIEVIGNMS